MKMNADETLFLKTLSRELSLLNVQERKNLLLEYQNQIDERTQKGEEVRRIVASFDTPDEIAKKVYIQAGINPHALRRQKRTHLWKWIGVFLSTPPQGLMFIIGIGLMIIGFGAFVASIAAFVFSWLNFDLFQAIGLSLLSIGLLPLLGIGLMWSGWHVYHLESAFFKVTWKKSLLFTSNKNFSQASKKSKKIVFFIFTLIFGILTLGGIIGTFAGDNTVGDALISGNLIHNQTEDLDILGFMDQEQIDETAVPMKISLDSLKSSTWYEVLLKEDNDSTGLEISRDYNTKESFKLKYHLEKNLDQYLLKVDVPWNLWVFNISSNKFVLTYNPNLIEFN